MSRAAPDFIGLGPQRSATTWLYNCLKEHPEVRFPLGKEAHLFDQENMAKKRVQKYCSAFNETDRVAGEITPNYLWEEAAPRRIGKICQPTKLFCVLRNPIDRAYSQYALDRRNEVVDLPFSSAITEKPEYLERGRYIQQLRRYERTCTDHQMRVFLFDNLKREPEQFLRSVYAFIGVGVEFVPRALERQANRGLYSEMGFRPALIRFGDWVRNFAGIRAVVDEVKTWKPVRRTVAWLFDRDASEGIDPGLRRQLWEYFREDVEGLAEYLARPKIVEDWRPD